MARRKLTSAPIDHRPQAALPPASPHPPVMEDPVQRLLAQVVEEPAGSPLQRSESLRGRCAIVTGGSSGIGRAVCLELARHGVHVAFNYLGDAGGAAEEEAQRTVREIAQLEVRVHVEECDVRDAGAVRGFVERSRQALGAVHILVNNAGISHDRALWMLTDEQWTEVVDANLTGAFYMLRAVTPIMRGQADGKIVNVASVHALRGEFGLANYSASKGGLLALTRAAAIELGPSNINVNAVAPGYIRTTRVANSVPAEVLDRAREKSALGRLGNPQDVANVVLFLCSELARHVTGTVIPVDGGHVI